MGLALTFKAVSKKYPSAKKHRSLLKHFFSPSPHDDHWVFNNLNLEVRSGEKIVLRGANGAGKTTLLKLAGGLIQPNLGDVFVEGEQASRVSRLHLGVMLHTQLLYASLTGYQNLEYATRLRGLGSLKALISNAIQQWKLNEFIDKLIENCSQGQRARIALARATIGNPPLVLLDEPLSFLDIEGKHLFYRYLSRTQSTVLATSQVSFEPGTYDREVFL